MDASDSKENAVESAKSQSAYTSGFSLGGFGGPSKSRFEGFTFNCQDYTYYDNRLRSFHNWPKTHPMKAQTLAGAGFHYTQMEFLKIFVLNWSLENKMLTDKQTNKPSETHQFQKTPSYLIGVLVTTYFKSVLE